MIIDYQLVSMLCLGNSRAQVALVVRLQCICINAYETNFAKHDHSRQNVNKTPQNIKPCYKAMFLSCIICK